MLTRSPPRQVCELHTAGSPLAPRIHQPHHHFSERRRKEALRLRSRQRFVRLAVRLCVQLNEANRRHRVRVANDKAAVEA